MGFGIPGIIASYFGASLAISAPPDALLRILGAFLIAYVILLAIKPAFKLAQNNLAAISGGTFSGFLAGVLGIGGAIRGLFLSAFDLPKAVYIFTSGAIALGIDSTRLITYYLGGAQLESTLLWGMLIFIPASFVGAGIAKRMVDKIPQNKFRIVVASFLFLVGVKLLLF